MEERSSIVNESEGHQSTSQDPPLILPRTDLVQPSGIHRFKYISPKYKAVLNKINRRKNLQKRRRRRIQFLENLGVDEVLDRFTSSMNTVTAQFIKKRLQLQGLIKKDCPYSIDDKIILLLLYKQNKSFYELLSNKFSLPSPKTITRLLRCAGINETVFSNLKTSLSNLLWRDRYCILIFDEIVIQPHLYFNRGSGDIEGFEDFGDESSNGIADHAVVFMLKGIRKSWKQPVCYFCSKGPMKSKDLARRLKQVLAKCFEINANIIGTVSDQRPANIAAINLLTNNTKAKYLKNNRAFSEKFYEVNNNKIFHVYDPPNLLKDIRNHFLNKNLVMEINGQLLTAKWCHIETCYKTDSELKICYLRKLTDFHVMKSKINKTKVSYAAQVLSRSVAAIMALMARLDVAAHFSDASETASVVLFLNKLFDSVNGRTLKPPAGNDLRCAISTKSAHLTFWLQAKQILKSTRFIDEETSAAVCVPSINNWLHTITSLEEIFKILKAKDISFVMPRVFNLDSLEGLFGQIRQHRYPTCFMFKNHYKNFLLNNLVARPSVDAESLNIMGSVNSKSNTIDTPIAHSSTVSMFTSKTYIDKVIIRYVSGWIKKNIKKLPKCSICKNNILCSDKTQWQDPALETEFVESVPHRLRYCSPKFIFGISVIYDIIKMNMSRLCHEKGVLEIFRTYIHDNVHFDFEHCDHSTDFINTIIQQFTMLCIFNWCNGVNDTINGKRHRIVLPNCVYKQAIEIYRKRKYRK